MSMPSVAVLKAIVVTAELPGHRLLRAGRASIRRGACEIPGATGPACSGAVLL